MKTPMIPLALLAATLSFGAMAACDKGSTVVFSCATSKGKVIEVCDAKQTIDYSFGKPSEKPEIVLRVPRQEASTSQWSGVGRWASYTVDIPNGKTVYSVFWGVDRLSEKKVVEAGVIVEVDKKLVATVPCAPNSKIVQAIEGIDLKRNE